MVRAPGLPPRRSGVRSLRTVVTPARRRLGPRPAAVRGSVRHSRRGGASLTARLLDRVLAASVPSSYAALQGKPRRGGHRYPPPPQESASVRDQRPLKLGCSPGVLKEIQDLHSPVQAPHHASLVADAASCTARRAGQGAPRPDTDLGSTLVPYPRRRKAAARRYGAPEGAMDGVEAHLPSSRGGVGSGIPSSAPRKLRPPEPGPTTASRKSSTTASQPGCCPSPAQAPRRAHCAADAADCTACRAGPGDSPRLGTDRGSTRAYCMYSSTRPQSG